MSDDAKPAEAVEAPKVESEAPKVEAPEIAETTTKTEIKEDAAAAGVEKKSEAKSEETAEVKKNERAEKNGNSKTERSSRSRSPYSKRRRDDRSRSPRNDRRNNDRRGRGRDHHNGGERKPFKNHKDNIKSQYEFEESSDPDEIRKQVEFYFSDSNLCRDKFLFTQTGGPDNKPVPISVIHSFKRMRHFQPFSAVVAALKESKTLEVVDNDEIKRKEPLPVGKDVNFEDSVKFIEDAVMHRSIYVKGFGEETPKTQLAVEDFFAPFGPVKMVKLRRTSPENEFKGSAFVEFESTEVMQEFMDIESKPKWEGKELKYQTKKDYCANKVEDINAGKIRPNEKDERGSFRGRGGGRGRGDRGRGRGRGGRGNNDRRDRGDRNGDDRDWKTRRDEDKRKDRNGGDRRRRSPSAPKTQVDDRFVSLLFFTSPMGSNFFSVEVFQSFIPAHLLQLPSLPMARRKKRSHPTTRSVLARMMVLVRMLRLRKSRQMREQFDDDEIWVYRARFA
jgi:lupus La protein